MEEVPGDFSDGGPLALVMLAVRVEMEGKVCEDDVMGRLWEPNFEASHGRWAIEGSILKIKDDRRLRSSSSLVMGPYRLRV
jgi:hypothetical protein